MPHNLEIHPKQFDHCLITLLPAKTFQGPLVFVSSNSSSVHMHFLPTLPWAVAKYRFLVRSHCCAAMLSAVCTVPRPRADLAAAKGRSRQPASPTVPTHFLVPHFLTHRQKDVVCIWSQVTSMITAVTVLHWSQNSRQGRDCKRGEIRGIHFCKHRFQIFSPSPTCLLLLNFLGTLVPAFLPFCQEH